jgi:acyl carrier protein
VKKEMKMEKLLKILLELHPDVDFETEEHLLTDMILDSFDIVTLISEINDIFDVSISAADIIPENFNSAQSLYSLIEKLEYE